MNALTLAKQINPLEVFSNNGLNPILEEITRQVKAFQADTSTLKGRKEIASLAYKVAQSKTFMDNAGKELVSGWKAKTKTVDSERKRMRDYLDSLKNEVRKPLTEWEEAEKERIKKETVEKEYAEAWERASVENDLFNRNRAIEKKEAELRRVEAERLAREAAEREAKESERLRIKSEQDRKDREERLVLEAAEKARKEAEEKSRKEKEEFERRERIARDAVELAERERIAAQERAKD